jgi:hypothetical protein
VTAIEAISQAHRRLGKGAAGSEDRLIAIFAEREYLLAVDKCEHPVDRIRETRRCMTLLATSREALGSEAPPGSFRTAFAPECSGHGDGSVMLGRAHSARRGHPRYREMAAIAAALSFW